MEKIFLFDIGNVIFKGHNAPYIYKKMGCTCTFEEFEKEFRHSQLYYDVEHGIVSTEKYVEELKKRTGSNISVKKYIKVHHESKGNVYSDTLGLIKRLHEQGYKVGILSNLKKIDVVHFKSLLDDNILDYEFYSCYLNFMKPESDIYEHVRKVTHADENEVYFFDDLEENVKEARKHNIKAIQTTGATILEAFNENVKLEGEN